MDVYWETLPAQNNFVTLALYGAFFPQIVSGPVQRAGDFFGQIGKLQNPDPGEFAAGLRRILFGLFKKIVIADYLAAPVASVHADPSRFSSLELLFGAYCFAIELYADFSGITDIAIGIGQLFGIKGPENFDLPYYSPNIQMFWRRWHMSLTSWLTDYLFTPLRMSLRTLGSAGLYLAVVLNFIAIGLWHGLTWVFFFFGLLNGIYMVVSVMTLKQRNRFFQARPALAQIRAITGPLITFHLMVFAMIFFRSETLSSAFKYVGSMVPGWGNRSVTFGRFDQALLGVAFRPLMLCFIAFFASEAVTWAARRQICVDWFFTMPVFFRRALYCALAATVLLFFKDSLTFIYARF
ncbi:MAG TPA: MBOAT family O-acyltransferase [Verrucomicrobiae bacterium]